MTTRVLHQSRPSEYNHYDSLSYLVPHEGQDQRVEGTPLSGHKDQKVPEGRATIPSVSNLADASSNSWPIHRQLMIETSHQNFHSQESHLEQSGTMGSRWLMTRRRSRIPSAVDT